MKEFPRTIVGKLEATAGLEPANGGFAVPSVSQLRHVAPVAGIVAETPPNEKEVLYFTSFDVWL